MDPAEFACLKAIVLFRAGSQPPSRRTLAVVFFQLAPHFRDPRLERPEPDREPAGPGSGDAVATLSDPAAGPGGTVRPAAADAAAAEDGVRAEGGGGFFSEDHR